MRKLFLLAILAAATTMSLQAKQPAKIQSQNGKLTAVIQNNDIAVKYGKQTAIELNGILDNSNLLRFVRSINEDYYMVAGKQLHCVNHANEYVADKNDCKLVFRIYDDGIAFRYEYENLKAGPAPQENTTFRIKEGTKRWMQKWSDGSEGFYPVSTTSKAENGNNRWGFPLLIEPEEDLYALISEADITGKQSAACLYSDGELFKVVPDVNKATIEGKWHTPWRVVIIGKLSDIVESTLVTDVSTPSQITKTSWIKPGVVSWVYWAYNHGSNDYNIIKKYVDLAVALKLPYVLIDAEWDEMKDGKTIEDAVKYALDNGVKPMIWYNSTVGWIDGAPGPKYRLNKPEDREKEFAWCEKIGVAGVKIDFFAGETQMNMDYCIELLEATAHHHLLCNFHGATVPRGWQRTWPNLLSTEGVYGAEWYNNVPTFTDKAAKHNATLPFTRNVIGPMDYTPCAFSDSQHPHITTHAHELALTVLFESGLQHIADRPESLLEQPQMVRDFFSELPVAWDETRLVDGFPGDFVVMARRSGSTWYIAGINGTDEERTLPVKFNFVKPAKPNSITLFADGSPWDISSPKKMPTALKVKPRGGFVIKIKI